ncbi:MAG: hypothetical protein GXO03_00210 [Aquificae bacterium]|nr:hypothetical protein [Aquificota bacterium]
MAVLLFLLSLSLTFPLEKLEKLLRTTQTVKVGFTQKTSYDWFPKEEISRGVFYASRNGKFRLEYYAPERVTVVSDGRTVVVLNHDEKTVFTERFNARGELLYGLFVAERPLNELFELTAHLKKDGREVFVLKPKRDETVREVKLVLKGDEPERLVILYGDGGKTVFEITEFKRNFEPTEELFKIELPEGYRVQQYGD